MNTDNTEDEITQFLHKRLKSYVDFEREWSDIFARFLTKSIGSLWFLNTIAVCIVIWIAWNNDWLPYLHPFDPYPYGILLMIVSFVAMLLAIVVLINQNQQGRMSDIRQRIDFEINVRAEREITKVLTMLEELREQFGLVSKDKELERMKEKISIAEIQEVVELGIETESGKQPPKDALPLQ